MLKKGVCELQFKRAEFGVIDPIDGTNNFVSQQGRFCCHDGFYFENGQGQFGLIYDVVKGDLLPRWWGISSLSK